VGPAKYGAKAIKLRNKLGRVLLRARPVPTAGFQDSRLVPTAERSGRQTPEGPQLGRGHARDERVGIRFVGYLTSFPLLRA